MTDLNHVVLIGRLTRDAELKYINSGTAVTKMSLAVNRRKRSGDGWTEEASFFDVTLWGKLGESLNQYLKKGKQIAVEGELRQNRWEQDGQPRSKVEIVANNLQLLGGSGRGSSGQNQQSGGNNSQFGGGYSAPGPGVADDFDDDIPF
ncbi:MAG: single-stranded DNA-binding protein [Spirochaetia bacterium]